MRCSVCNKKIAKSRAEFLSITGREPTCVKHSGEDKRLTLMEYGHKTAGEIVVVTDDPEQRRMALRAYHRSR
jgi:hypothetical protein